MKNVTEESNPLLLYVSGLFDGCGCVKIETPKKGERAVLYAWITTKHFSAMEPLQNLGAHVSKRPDGQYRAKWRDQRAYTLLKRMLPHLRMRKEQAKCGMEFLDNKKRDPQEDNDNVYKLRLRLLKREEEVIDDEIRI